MITSKPRVTDDSAGKKTEKKSAGSLAGALKSVVSALSGAAGSADAGKGNAAGSAKTGNAAGAKTGGTAQRASSAAAQREPVRNGYVPGDAVRAARSEMDRRTAAAAQREAYAGSPYDADVTEAYRALKDREPFSYDVNSDALYRMYRDMYAENGRQASLDAAGQAASLTGGYGNSYAGSAANAAYGRYMGQLNDRAIDLYDRARREWQDEGDRLKERYGAARDMSDADRKKWEDEYSRALAERDYAARAYENEYARDYAAGRDRSGDDRKLAMAMLEAGLLPGEELLRSAGIAPEDAERLAGQNAPKQAGAAAKSGTGDIAALLKKLQQAYAARGSA